MNTHLSRLLFSVVFLITQISTAHAEQPAGATLGAATSKTYDYIKAHDYPFYQNADEVTSAVNEGALVPLSDLGTYDVITKRGTQYALPPVATFVSRLGKQFAAQSCGKLIITAGVDTTLPATKTDRRSHHATGMVVDIVTALSASNACRFWLEQTLLLMESEGRIDISQKTVNLHDKRYHGYHVNVYVEEYSRWLEENT